MNIFTFTSMLILFGLSTAHSQRVIEITLKDYLKKVSKNYDGIKSSRKDVDIAEARFEEFRNTKNSPVLSGDYAFNRDNREETSSHVVAGNLKKKIFETGTGFDLGYNYTDKQPSKSELTFGLSQSLLKNAPYFHLPGKKQLDAKKLSVKVAKSLFNSKLEQYLFDALQQYFRYELTKQSIELSKQTLEDSEKVLIKNQRKVELGSADITSVYDSQILLIQAKEDILKSQNDLYEIAENLLNYLGETSINREDVNFNFLTKLDSKVQSQNTDAVYSNAFRFRKDIERAKLDKKIKKLNLDVAKFNQVPLLDLTFQMSFAGVNADSSRALSETFSNSPDFKVGVKFEMPLEKDYFKIKKEPEEATAEYIQSKINLDKLTSDVKLELNKLLRTMDYLEKRIEENKLALEIQTKNIAEYKKNFNNGKIDLQAYTISFDELRRRRNIYLQSVFEYETVKAQLDIAQGKFLSNYGIEELDLVPGRIKNSKLTKRGGENKE